MSNKKMHSIFACTSSENDLFECDRSRPFNSWLKCEAKDVIHRSIDQATRVLKLAIRLRQNRQISRRMILLRTPINCRYATLLRYFPALKFLFSGRRLELEHFNCYFL